MHHSLTSTYIPNFIEIKETFCGRTDIWTGGRTFETHFIRWTQWSRPKKWAFSMQYFMPNIPQTFSEIYDFWQSQTQKAR